MTTPNRKRREAATGSSTGDRFGPSRDVDPHGWALTQVELLRAGRLAEIDTKGIAEELRAMGREQYFKLESALRVLLLHLLKWDAQPDKRSRSWMLSISEQRRQVERQLQDNPGLQPRLTDAIRKAYRPALDCAVRETKLDHEHFPDDCPYTFTEIMQMPTPFDSARRWR